MRRIQAILAIVALLSVPLAVFARGEACEKAECPCCIAHASESHGKRVACSHCASRGKCGMDAPAAPDYGLNSPMAPTTPETPAVLPELGAACQDVVYSAQSIASGFISAPFNPPRS